MIVRSIIDLETAEAAQDLCSFLNRNGGPGIYSVIETQIQTVTMAYHIDFSIQVATPLQEFFEGR